MSRKTEYSKEFKEEAIRLCKAKGSNKAEIARKLGLTYKTLCNWVYDSNDEISPEEKAEIKRLNKEIARLKEENEILKKASANEAKRKLKPLPLMQPANA